MTLRTIKITEQFADIDKVNALALEAFPPEEYLAPSEMICMAQEAGFDFWALYDNDMYVGFMTVKTYKHITYLFFLAIDSKQRSHGYGSKAIETLKSLYPKSQQVVDFEMIDETANNNKQRKIRRQFYLRNGYKPTGQFLSYLGVNYEILCMEEAFDFETFKEMMSCIKIEGFNPQYFRLNT